MAILVRKGLSCGKVRNKSLEILFQHSAQEEAAQGRNEVRQSDALSSSLVGEVEGLDTKLIDPRTHDAVMTHTDHAKSGEIAVRHRDLCRPRRGAVRDHPREGRCTGSVLCRTASGEQTQGEDSPQK